MTDKKITIDRAAILSMTSVNPSRIRFPYDSTADILFYAESLIAEAMPTIGYPKTDDGAERYTAACLRILGESTINAYLTLQTSTTHPRAGLDIEVMTPNGQRLQTHVYASSAGVTAAEIITDYLMDGAPGLREDARHLFKRQHRDFLRRAMLNGGNGLRVSLHDFCTIFSKVVRKGYSPQSVAAALD